MHRWSWAGCPGIRFPGGWTAELSWRAGHSQLLVALPGRINTHTRSDHPRHARTKQPEPEQRMRFFERRRYLLILVKTTAKDTHSTNDFSRHVTNIAGHGIYKREGCCHTIDHSFGFASTFQLSPGPCIVNIGKPTYIPLEVTR